VAWREAVGEGFGPHREGEPAGLRRDIIDELTDHLDCAMRRELVAAPDERAAERKVLARFGDPRRIARRLWLDAMKETIMSQRIMLGVVVLLAVACVAASVFAWLSFQQGQQLNQALLARLEEMASRPAAAAVVPSDLAVATFRLVEEGEDGKPVANARVALVGNPFLDKDRDTIAVKTGADGVATLGPIRPGRYHLTVSIPAGFDYTEGRLALFGGSENEKVIVCPRGAGVAAPETDVSVSLAWPEDLAVEGVLTHGTFEPIPFHVDTDGFNWRRYAHKCWVTDGGEFLEGSVTTYGSGLVAIDKMRHSLVKPMRAGQYRLRSISVWTASSAAERAELGGYIGDKLRHSRRGEQVYEGDTEAPTFEAQVGAVNEWKIDIPEGLLAKLREALAEQEGQSQPAPNSSGFGRGTPVVPRGGGIDLGMTSGDEEENK